MNKRSFGQRLFRRLVIGIITSSSFLAQNSFTQPLRAATSAYCQLSEQAIADKQNLLQAALKGDTNAQQQYQALIKQHGDLLKQCRDKTWPQEQAIWLRPYPCDVNPGAIEATLDRIVNRGYNTVYIEVFFNSQVLLPAADNPTPWDSVARTPGAEKVDLLEKIIQKGRERGLKVYAWLFTMNFGYAYAQRSDRQSALARNSKGENTTTFVHDQSQAFIDPYNSQAQADYYQLVQAVLKRRPDGVLFDYIRYPRGTGPESVVGNVKDLWIYGQASRQALYNRALNNQGRVLIERYVSQGNITANDVASVLQQYPDEATPLWQGRKPSEAEAKTSAGNRYPRLKFDLWYLSVAHAAQGVVDFLTMASTPVQRQGIPAGAVFFPDGNQVVGKSGFDSRLQAWDKFPPSLEWHPMSYGVCNNTNCIVDQVKRVVTMAPAQTKIVPAIAGLWGKNYDNRPSLEDQMAAIHANFPQIRSVSHFSFSWQEPEFENQRRSCKL